MSEQFIPFPTPGISTAGGFRRQLRRAGIGIGHCSDEGGWLAYWNTPGSDAGYNARARGDSEGWAVFHLLEATRRNTGTLAAFLLAREVPEAGEDG